ncbi:MAG: DUF1835 domain-containing protein [Rhodospirillaceae bacterium]
MASPLVSAPPFAGVGKPRRDVQRDAPDGDRPTIHLRCGSDIRQTLREGGFVGGFVEYADPVCQGPVPDGPGLLSTRAAFLAEEYGIDAPRALRRLEAEEAALDTAVSSGERVVLWFEHDTYDQLLLARVLARFVAAKPTLELICIDRFPGIVPFRGLGQLGPADLRALWVRRRPVAPGQVSLGQRVWRALRAITPMPLHVIACGGTQALPLMTPALVRHLAELPWSRDGLSMTERLLLQALEAGPASVEVLFRRYEAAEPLPYLGDLMVLPIVRRLLEASDPAVAITPDSPPTGGPFERRIALTTTGRALLAGRMDWMTCGPRDRWVGGIRISADNATWRWDAKAVRPVLD